MNCSVMISHARSLVTHTALELFWIVLLDYNLLVIITESEQRNKLQLFKNILSRFGVD